MFIDLTPFTAPTGDIQRPHAAVCCPLNLFPSTSVNPQTTRQQMPYKLPILSLTVLELDGSSPLTSLRLVSPVTVCLHNYF